MTMDKQSIERVLLDKLGGRYELSAARDISELLQAWQHRDPENAEWKRPQVYAVLAKRFIDHGLPYSAQEIAEAGSVFAQGVERLPLKHLLGLALARCGLVDTASEVLSNRT